MSQAFHEAVQASGRLVFLLNMVIGQIEPSHLLIPLVRPPLSLASRHSLRPLVSSLQLLARHAKPSRMTIRMTQQMRQVSSFAAFSIEMHR